MPLCASVYLCLVVTCWERADLWLSFVVYNREFVTFPLVSVVWCGTWLYRFLIFAPLLTFMQHICLLCLWEAVQNILMLSIQNSISLQTFYCDALFYLTKATMAKWSFWAATLSHVIPCKQINRCFDNLQVKPMFEQQWTSWFGHLIMDSKSYAH